MLARMLARLLACAIAAGTPLHDAVEANNATKIAELVADGQVSLQSLDDNLCAKPDSSQRRILDHPSQPAHR